MAHDEARREEVARWELADSPLVTIAEDLDRSRSLWTGISRAFRYPDGRIGVLVSGPAPWVRIFDSDGELLTEVGEQGDGPGEIGGRPSWAGAAGDSTVILYRNDLVFYDGTGTYVRSVSLPQELLPSEQLDILATGAGGWLFAVPEAEPDGHGPPDPEPDVTRRTTIVRVDPGGGATDTLATFHTLQYRTVQGALWGAARHQAASRGTDIYTFGPRQYEITVHRDGRPFRLIRAPVESLTELSGRHIDVARDVWGEDFINPRLAEWRQQGLLVPPAALEVLAAPDGSVWVRRTDDGRLAEERTWDVYDERGVWAAVLDVPAEFAIEYVGEGTIVGIWTDRFDVESVRVYAIPDGSDQ